MAADLEHDRALRLRPARLFRRGAGRDGGDDGDDLCHAAAVAAVGLAMGRIAGWHRLADDERGLHPDAALLPLPGRARAAAAGNRVVLHGGDGRLGDPVLARPRRPMEGPLSGSDVLTPLVRTRKGRDKVWPPAIGEMRQRGAEPAETFELMA